MGFEIADDFSGVVSVIGPDGVEFEHAAGFADRAHEIAITSTNRFATASATKTYTAATVLALVDDGTLTLDTTARSVLGADLPLITDDVTVAHLLTHRSGIGDYCDEDLPEILPPTVSFGELSSTPAYLPALDGFPAKFAPGEQFGYCNGGFVVLAVIAERVSGQPFEKLVRDRVFGPAKMPDSDFLRSDHLPGTAALGYLDDGRTNVFAIPVLGSGDGGAYSTVADVHAFWTALTGGALVSAESFAFMRTPWSTETDSPYSYGGGMWLVPDTNILMQEGSDNGASFRSLHDVDTARTATVVSNTSDGAWPIAVQLRAQL